jgi:nucleobase:cation symporter-1, NCS1 family
MTTQAIPVSSFGHGDFVELTHDVSSSPLWNADLAPTTIAQRKWSVWSIAALWISMSACIPTYMLASGLIDQGMDWKQAVLTIFLGNVIVLIPMVLNAHAGTKYGIPFPVYCRASFGVKGANVPALLRALVACGWFGIQTWIGGEAIYKIACVLSGNATMGGTPLPGIGINTVQLGCFLLFWAINVAVIIAGIESIRILLNIKAPLLIVLGLALLWWAYQRAGGFGPMLTQKSAFAPGGPRAGEFWKFLPGALTGMVGFWATLSLNIPDFSRYARSQKDQVIGQSVGLPTTMALYSFIGVAVTSATIVIYGKALWDPIDVLMRMESNVALIVSMLAICIATLATNIAANVVSPANDFAHLAPRYITFRIGGIITAIIGILMMPWKLIESSQGYIFSWLVAYSALLGAIGGILICDYWLLRRTRLRLGELFEENGNYGYDRGYNWCAILSMTVGIAWCAAGFIDNITNGHFLGASRTSAFFRSIYNYGWFVTFAVSFALYAVFMFSHPSVRRDARETTARAD